MRALRVLDGMRTSSWYAMLALRTRVSMSAMGSVMVMVGQRPFSSWFPVPPSWAAGPSSSWGSPGALRDARELAAVGHLTQADAAEAELAVHRVRTAAAVAPRVAAHLELRRARRLVDQRLLGHGQISLKGKPRCLSRDRPSASVLAVVTTVMSMPRTRSVLSWSISWNMACSVSPNV